MKMVVEALRAMGKIFGPTFQGNLEVDVHEDKLVFSWSSLTISSLIAEFLTNPLFTPIKGVGNVIFVRAKGDALIIQGDFSSFEQLSRASFINRRADYTGAIGFKATGVKVDAIESEGYRIFASDGKLVAEEK